MTVTRRHDRRHDELADDVTRLERILAGQTESHRGLRARLERKREAIRSADIDAITALCREESELAQCIRTAERERAAVTERLARRLGPRPDAPLTIAEIAAAADPEAGAGLLDRAETLRREISAVRRESTIVTDAACALSRHVAGIMQTVNSALSRVGVYERRGRIAVGAQMEFSVDVKS